MTKEDERAIARHRFSGVEVAACLYRTIRKASDNPIGRTAAKPSKRESRAEGCREAHSSVEAG